MSIGSRIRIPQNAVLFLLIMAALLIGLTLETSGSFRELWTWIPALIGAAIFEIGTYLIYRGKPEANHHTR